ncbi:MAG: isoprenyl transferase [Candidatus Latescibacterota bacterium]
MDREADQTPLEQLRARGNLPRHIAIVMDGNGRWASQRGLSRSAGHRAGRESVRHIVEACGQLGIEVLTLYTFSVENRNRPWGEVLALMRILRDAAREELQDLMANNVRLMTVGRTHELPRTSREALRYAIEQTAGNTGLILNLALNYGGRTEIVDAFKRMASEIAHGQLTIEEITEQCVADHLYTSGLPEPDLFIRTSGEMRVSNFLLYQIAYSEIYVTEVLWPDFRPAHLYQAVESYQGRERRFGRTSQQMKG